MSLPFMPYLYLLVSKENIQEVTAFLSKKYGQYITQITQVIICVPGLTFLSSGIICRFIKKTLTSTIILLD